MFDTKYPTLSVLADILRCRAVVVVTCILLPGLSAMSALAATDDTPVSVPPLGQGEAPAVAPKAPATTESPAATGMPTFSIYEYTVDGNSLLSGLSIENAVSAFMGEGKTLRDVEGARAALERAYHDVGYMTVVVSIPEQSVDAGAVALHVVEASIDRLKVKGAEYALSSKIKSRLPELAEGKVPNFNTVQADLTALNRGADVKVTPILRAGKEPGTVEVQLDVVDQLPLHGSLEYSNRQTPNTTAQRLSASLRYDNLWQRGHSFGLTLQTAPERPSDARVLAGTYVLPVDSTGDSLTLYAVHSRSQFASLSGAPGLGLLGNTDTLGTRLSPLLASTADYAQTFSVGLDYKNVKQTLVLQGGGGSDSPISYVPLVATYTGNLFGQNRSTTLDVTATSGLRGFFGNNDAEFNAKRSGASASFLALRTGLQHTESFSRWALYGKLDMQMSSGPLVPTEQFLAGGAESVRGYLEGEQAGDSGMRATVELRTPQFNLGGQDSAWRLSGLAFLDAARLSIRQPVAPQPEVQRLRGTGFGLRFVAPRGLTVEVDAARALLDGDITRAGEKRVHARTLWAF
jgi:hemolysin activation/secretion protein